MAHRRLGRPGGGRFKCAAVSRAHRLESDALVMAQERAPIDDLGCVGDFDGVPELVPDERELLPLVLAGSDADHEVTTSAGAREEQQPRLWLAARSDSAQIVLEVHDQVRGLDARQQRPKRRRACEAPRDEVPELRNARPHVRVGLLCGGGVDGSEQGERGKQCDDDRATRGHRELRADRESKARATSGRARVSAAESFPIAPI